MNNPDITINTDSPEGTRELGALLGRMLCGGEILLLDGDLGAGKTCLAQGVARGLGICGEVTSPTFVLHCQYQGRLELNHIDAYRLEDAPHVEGLGFDEFFGRPDNVCLIEWAQMISSILPPGCVHVYISNTSPTAREFRFSATAEPGAGFMRRLCTELAGKG